MNHSTLRRCASTAFVALVANAGCLLGLTDDVNVVVSDDADGVATDGTADTDGTLDATTPDGRDDDTDDGGEDVGGGDASPADGDSTPDSDAENPADAGDAGGDTTAEGCTSDSDCPGPWACDRSVSPSVCYVSCADDDDLACKASANCEVDTCVEFSPPVWNRVAIVSRTVDEDSLANATPGPDIDAIMLARSAGGTSFAFEVVAQSAPGTRHTDGSVGSPAAILGAPDAFAGVGEDCNLDETLYHALGEDEQFVVLQLEGDDPVAGDTLTVIELSSENCGNVAVERLDQYEVFIASAITPAPVTIDDILNDDRWCSLGLSSASGGLGEFELDFSDCIGPRDQRCGNGRIDDDEVCDGSAVAGEHSCESVTTFGGTLTCSDYCGRLDISGCTELPAGTGCDGGCPEGTDCVADACLAPPTADADTYVAAARWGMVTEWLLRNDRGQSSSAADAQLDRTENCCFDFDGDGEIDNALADIVTALESLSGEDLSRLSRTDLTRQAVIEERQNGHALHLWAAFDIDEGATAVVDGNEFQARGAPVQFNRLDVEFLADYIETRSVEQNGIVYMPGGWLGLFTGAFGFDEDSDTTNIKTIRASRLRFEIDYTRVVGGLQSRQVAPGGTAVDAVRVGGLIDLDDIFEELAPSLQSCTCGAGIDGPPRLGCRSAM